jgi:hypothetical protein
MNLATQPAWLLTLQARHICDSFAAHRRVVLYIVLARQQYTYIVL